MAMNGYFVQQVKYVFYYPQKVLNLPSVFFQVVSLTILLSFVHLSYFKIGQGIKDKVKAGIHYWNRIIDSSWNIGCLLLMILMCSYGIFTPLSSLEDISVQETNLSSEFAFSLLCSFLFHSTFLSCKLNGFCGMSIRWVVATIALCQSYAAKCLKIGATFVLIWSVVTLIMDVISLSINILEVIYKRPMGGTISSTVAVAFSIVWAFFYLYLYPLFVLLPASALNSPNSSISLISLLLLTLWCEYFLDWYSTPFIKLLWMLSTRSFPPNWLSHLFLTQKNDVTQKLLMIRKSERGSHCVQSEETKARQNSQTMVQTIKCVLLLKKKLRRMRERKNLEMCGKSDDS